MQIVFTEIEFAMNNPFDRTIKILLALLVAALWCIALRPGVNSQTSSGESVATMPGGAIAAVHNGNLTLWKIEGNGTNYRLHLMDNQPLP